MVSSIVTGMIVYLPYIIVMLFVAKKYYGMVIPPNIVSVFVFIILGLIAMRAIGLTVDETMFTTLAASISERKNEPAPAV